MRIKNSLRSKIIILLTFFLTVPWFYLKFTGVYSQLYSPHVAFYSGLCVIASGFLLAWACETAEMDVPKSFAIAVVALIAILPEYAVDGYFAWTAGKNPEYTAYAVANMTGANRLLIGIGWSLLTLSAIWKMHRMNGDGWRGFVNLRRGLRLEMFFLLLATIYAFILPFKRQIDIFDAVVFVSIYIAYTYLAIKSPVEEFNAIGVTEYLCSLPKTYRRSTVVFMMLFSAFAILVSVEAFADSLIHTGEIFELDPFLMVQWIAPLASEAPEFVVAFIFVSKLRYTHSISVLISSKVNQWTLLLGTISIIYSISIGSITALPLDTRQTHEVFLTAAQSIFALSIILNRRFSVVEALALLSLFLVQFLIPVDEIRMIISGVYIVLSVFVFYLYRKEIRPMFEHILKTFSGKRDGESKCKE